MPKPGPWTAECVGSGGNYYNPTDVYDVTNGYKRIAEYLIKQDANPVGPPSAGWWSQPTPPARLIAAAPQLLEALQAMVDACEPHDSGMPLSQARAAIAAATGKCGKFDTSKAEE